MDLRTLPELPQLTQLSVGVRPGCLPALRCRTPNLLSLDLMCGKSSCSSASVCSMLGQLAGLPHLSSLHVWWLGGRGEAPLEPISLAGLQGLAELLDLHVQMRGRICLADLPVLPALTSLKVGGRLAPTRVGEPPLGRLSALTPLLQELALDGDSRRCQGYHCQGCECLSAAAIGCMAKLQHLTSLAFLVSEGADLAGLVQLSSLQHLTVLGSDPLGLPPLPSLTSLRLNRLSAQAWPQLVASTPGLLTLTLDEAPEDVFGDAPPHPTLELLRMLLFPSDEPDFKGLARAAPRLTRIELALIHWLTPGQLVGLAEAELPPLHQVVEAWYGALGSGGRVWSLLGV